MAGAQEFGSTGTPKDVTSHFFYSSGFPYPASFAKTSLLDVLFRFLGLVNSQAPYVIVGVDNFDNIGSRLP